MEVQSDAAPYPLATVVVLGRWCPLMACMETWSLSSSFPPPLWGTLPTPTFTHFYSLLSFRYIIILVSSLGLFLIYCSLTSKAPYTFSSLILFIIYF